MAIDYKILGNRIKIYRKELKLTQENFAERLGISASFESRVERGATKISLELLAKISEALNIPITQLLSGTVVNNNFLDEELSEIVKNFNPNNKKLLLDIAKSISQNIQ